MHEFHWETASTGSFIIREYPDEVVCTVYEQPKGVWRVVVNIDTVEGKQPHFSDRHFLRPADAKTYAEELLKIRAELEPTPISPHRDRDTYSEWRQQKTQANGQPTFGRKVGRNRLSVKCASSGMWYYLRHGMAVNSKPEGWFASAKEAMAAADKRCGALA